MADLLLYKLRKLALHAGFPPCSMGRGNMLPELASHKTCNSCAVTELMERRKKEGRKHGTQAKKPKSVDLQIKTHTHTHSVEVR